ncbi:putative bifunctional diguanylate cyclase/phosphodiesterase [Thioalbus denitrificans]|uniref:cyclic-guanylate-specific phosphodiesterase n=1 Tax=Thioalbus denitrificans TaxID=547122 RepID=A0A369CN65_9GAMM|nr:bifunctional diguanylate cyclase/phosphodiesterase [Thioalbus denitrificans]RCX33294.1 PAS domain S-box-containing protein/diguanylate cyclase (GGDEF)-like protein [Thioalbus denitrificans]
MTPGAWLLLALLAVLCTGAGWRRLRARAGRSAASPPAGPPPGVLDRIGAAVLATDPGGRLIYLNADAVRLTGLDPEAALRQPLAELLPGLSPDPESVAPSARTLRLPGTAGGEVEWETRALPATDGGAGGLVWVFRHAGDPGPVERQLRLFARVFEHSADAIMVTDGEGRIVRVNEAFTRITGYSPAEVLGRNPRMLQSGLHDEEFYAGFWNALRKEGTWQGEIWNRRKNGEIYPQWMSIGTLDAEAGEVVHFVAIFTDITDKKRSEDTIHYLAYYDGLTSLPNRPLFEEKLVQALRDGQRNGRWVAILYLDLDRFKDINDSLGHASGDRLLRSVATRLLETVRNNDVVARLGGDEFVILLSDLADGNAAGRAAATVARKVIAALADPFNLEGHEVLVTASIGVALAPQDGEDAGELIKNADTAMYQVKSSGKGHYQFFSREMNLAIRRRLRLEHSLRKALEHDEFHLVFQPQVSVRQGTVIGMEALLRWRQPHGEIIPPGEFIQLAEETGLILPIDEWVLRRACAQARSWVDAGIRDFRLAVNLSGRQFHRRGLILLVGRILSEIGLEPRYLELEITEGSVMADIDRAVEVLRGLRQMGVRLAVDDFGTGYSSLSYLRRLPIHTLKVDRAFIREIATSTQDAAIVEAIIRLGHSLGLQLVAEGVEQPEQLSVLEDQGCDSVQGYLLSRPLRAADATSLLTSGRMPQTGAR